MRRSSLEFRFVFWTLLLFSVGMFLGIKSGQAAELKAAGAAWMPPFAPVSTQFAARAQNLMAPGLNPDSEFDRRLLGAMAAHLPVGFEARLNIDGTVTRETMAMIDQALAKAEPAARAAVRQRALEISRGVAQGTLKGAEVAAAADQLKEFSLYGKAVAKDIQSFSKTAAQAAKAGLTLRFSHDVAVQLIDRRDGGADAPPANAAVSAWDTSQTETAKIKLTLAKPKGKSSPTVENILSSIEERDRRSIENLIKLEKARDSSLLIAELKEAAKKERVGYVAYALKTLRHPHEIAAFRKYLFSHYSSEEATTIIESALQAAKVKNGVIQEGTESFWLLDETRR